MTVAGMTDAGILWILWGAAWAGILGILVAPLAYVVLGTN